MYGLAFSPDGKTLASCAADRTVKLWDWAGGKRIATLSDARAELYAVAFTPDGSRLLSAGVDRSIWVWRSAGGEFRLERSAFAHDAPVVRLAVSRDGRLLASSAEDRSVKLWRLDTLESQSAVPAQADWVQSLAFSADSRRLALGRFDGYLALWNIPESKLVAIREPPAQAGRSTAAGAYAKLNPPSPRGAVQREPGPSYADRSRCREKPRRSYCPSRGCPRRSFRWRGLRKTAPRSI